MSIKRKRVASLVGIGLLVSMLGACKELEDLTTEISKDPENPGMYDSNLINNPGPSTTPDKSDIFSQAPVTLNLQSLKINGYPVDVSLSNVSDPWNASNNKPYINKGDRVNIVQVDFDIQNLIDAPIYYLQLTLRSLTGMQSINVAISQLAFSRGELTLTPETSINVNYDDSRGGYGFGYSFYDSQNNISNILTVKKATLMIDFSQLLSSLNVNYSDPMNPVYGNDHMHVPMPVPPTHTGGSGIDVSLPLDMLADNNTLAENFFSKDLFALNIYYDGGMLYKDMPISQLSNCVFSSADAPPADISDICQAYLTVYK